MGIGFGTVVSPTVSVRKHRYPMISVFLLHRHYDALPYLVGVLLLYIESNRVIKQLIYQHPDRQIPLAVLILL